MKFTMTRKNMRLALRIVAWGLLLGVVFKVFADESGEYPWNAYFDAVYQTGPGYVPCSGSVDPTFVKGTTHWEMQTCFLTGEKERGGTKSEASTTITLGDCDSFSINCPKGAARISEFSANVLIVKQTDLDTNMQCKITFSKRYVPPTASPTVNAPAAAPTAKPTETPKPQATPLMTGGAPAVPTLAPEQVHPPTPAPAAPACLAKYAACSSDSQCCSNYCSGGIECY